jgi:hypothetical protein
MKGKENKMSHTPGPWKAVDDVDEGVWVSPQNTNNNIICDIVGRIWDPEAKATQITDEDIENARLIAAAPDMLEALEKVIDLAKANRDDDGIFDEQDEEYFKIATAAIAKAKGEDVPA